MASKYNCWDFIECGRGPGGSKIAIHGACPSATETRADGLNSGKNGGRACWAIAGTLCSGAVRGTKASKIETCFECDFYSIVKSEEGSKYLNAKAIKASFI